MRINSKNIIIFMNDKNYLMTIFDGQFKDQNENQYDLKLLRTLW